MIAAVILLVAAVVWRVLLGVTHSADFGWLHNFAPMSAIALCGAAFLPRRLAFGLPLVALFVSDLILNVHYSKTHPDVALISYQMLARYGALALIAGLGWALRRSPRIPVMLGASAVSSAIFFVVSNTGSWITDAGYAKTFAGWFQALTNGLPGFPSTLWFYRHTLISDLLFTALFLVCIRLADRSATPEPAQARA
jgi:uncharacterized membrane protein YhdT